MLFQPFTALNSECIWGLLMSSGLAIFHWTFIWPMFANMASLQSSFSGCDLCLTFYNNHYWSILLNKVPADTETHQTNDMMKIKYLFGIMIRVQVPGLNASVADLNLKMFEYKQIILIYGFIYVSGKRWCTTDARASDSDGVNWCCSHASMHFVSWRLSASHRNVALASTESEQVPRGVSVFPAAAEWSCMMQQQSGAAAIVCWELSCCFWPPLFEEL